MNTKVSFVVVARNDNYISDNPRLSRVNTYLLGTNIGSISGCSIGWGTLIVFGVSSISTSHSTSFVVVKLPPKHF